MRKLIAMLLALCLLSGCRLASIEQKESPLQDKLVGVFLTFDQLDLEFDIEGYLNDNADSISDGDALVIDPDAGQAYKERLWATVSDRELTFPGYEGLVMGQIWMEDHWVGFSTEGFCEHKTHVTRTDILDGIDEEGTVYVPFGTDVMLCTNPIYMTADGTYYALQGDSFHSQVDSGSMSQSVSADLTWETEGESYTYSAKFTTTAQGVTLADKVVLVQMSSGHEELSRAEYVPGQMPESIVPTAETAYILVEECSGDTVTRSLCQPGGDVIKVFHQGDQIWCLPQFTEIMWEER